MAARDLVVKEHIRKAPVAAPLQPRHHVHVAPRHHRYRRVVRVLAVVFNLRGGLDRVLCGTFSSRLGHDRSLLLHGVIVLKGLWLRDMGVR